MSAPAVNVDAEAAVLGAVILNPELFAQCNGLKGEHFFRPAHQAIWETAKAIESRGEDLDATLLAEELDRLGLLQRVGGAPYLHTLISDVPVVNNAGSYARVVHDRWRLRQIDELGTRFKQIGANSDASEIVEAIEVARGFLDGADWVETGSTDDFDSSYEAWREWQARADTAIPSPWPSVNKALLGGFYKGRLYVIGGRPGCAKSTFALNAAHQAARAGYRSLVFSMEMSREEVFSRLVSDGAHVPLKDIFSHNLGPAAQSKIEQFATSRTRPLITIDDSASHTIETVTAKCRAVQRKTGLDLVVIDYLQLLDCPNLRNQAEHKQVSWIAKNAKLLSKRLDVAVILLSQLNRSIEYENRKPKMSDLREGGEQDADLVAILTRPDGHDIELNIVKSRNSGYVGTSLTLADELSYARLG